MRGRASLVGAATACVLSSGVLTALHARATEPPGSGFLGYTLSAQASGLQVVEDEPSATTHPEAESEVPQTQVSLVSGPVGYALSSVAWPGALAANAGSLLLLAGAPVPQDVAHQLNDPVRAETRTGGPASVENSSVPGAVMRAGVVPGRATADAVLDGGDAGRTAGFGATTARSTAVLGTDTATTTADSTTKDVSLAAGVVTLDSLVSHATATTDGRRSTASGTTTVNDLRVAGVPVTVDSRGITLASSTTPADASAVQEAVTQLGMTVLLSQPSMSRSGGSVSYDSGSLIVVWTPPGWGGTITVLLGGSRVSASASPADALPPSVGTSVPPDGGGRDPAPVGGLSGGPAAASPLPATGGTVVAPPATAQLSAPALVSARRPPGSSYALAVLGAALLLGALLRLPPLVLVPPAAATCSPRRTS